jgi:hypothetical protein
VLAAFGMAIEVGDPAMRGAKLRPRRAPSIASAPDLVTCATYAGLRCRPSIFTARTPMRRNSGSSSMVFRLAGSSIA